MNPFSFSSCDTSERSLAFDVSGCQLSRTGWYWGQGLRAVEGQEWEGASLILPFQSALWGSARLPPTLPSVCPHLFPLFPSLIPLQPHWPPRWSSNTQLYSHHSAFAHAVPSAWKAFTFSLHGSTPHLSQVPDTPVRGPLGAPAVGRVMAPKMPTSQPLKLNMSPHMAKGTLQI